MAYKNILMVVEPGFDSKHVGVARVIKYHWKRLVAAGHSVAFAAPINGCLVGCSLLDATQAMLPHRPQNTQPPTWRSGDGRIEQLMVMPNRYAPAPIKWNAGPVHVPDFDVSVMTNPWLYSQDGCPLEEQEFTVGIAYDMVPQLLAMNMLSFPIWLDAFKFATDHDEGYRYLLRNAKSVICISTSTENDFLAMYGHEAVGKTTVCIPFADFGDGLIHEAPNSHSILLVNILDVRKNFDGALEALRYAAKRQRLTVRIVGRERIPLARVMDFLLELEQICEHVEWHRSPSDSEMLTLMERSSMLFFPSIYEGCGLPILEAQAVGLPVVSSSNSSCGEMNQNYGTLTALPDDQVGLAERILDVAMQRTGFLRGRALRDAQIAFLLGRNDLDSVL
jgi:glycosyltransferase involved in cell wall biosynthesis